MASQLEIALRGTQVTEKHRLLIPLDVVLTCALSMEV